MDFDFDSELEHLLESVGSPMLCVLKDFTALCTDEKKHFADKATLLPTYWRTIVDYFEEPEEINLNEEIFKHAYQYTINIILDSAWFKVSEGIKDELRCLFKKCLRYFRDRNSILVNNVQGLVRLVDDPWGAPALRLVINDFDNARRNELEEFFNDENILLICTRIRILIQSKCEDLALRLLNAIVKFASIPHVSWIKLYINVMTNSINEIEKLRAEDKRDKLRAAEIRLADIFMLLSDVFKERIGIGRELVLTSFSLNPTLQCYATIKRLNRTMQRINPNLVSHDLKAIPPETGRVLVKSPLYNPYVVENHMVDACKVIGFNNSTTRDIVSICTSQRFRKLSWMIGWQNLRIVCKKYMKFGPVVMRNEYKELNFLKFDFNKLK